MGRGGSRVGAGRPQKAEKTKPIRVPERMVSTILSFLGTDGFKCPLYSSAVQAGVPSAAEDHIEARLNLNELLIPSPKSTFFVRVTGESMSQASIHPGDLLVVDRDMEPVNGKVVIAAIDGHLTVKRLIKNKKGIYQLMPENKRFKPITLLPENAIHILGVVTHVIHSLASG